MALGQQEKDVLEVLAHRLQQEHELWTKGRELRTQMEGTNASDKTSVLDGLVPTYLVRDGEPPSERYRFTLEGALESRYHDQISVFAGRLLEALHAIRQDDASFESFSIEDVCNASRYLRNTTRGSAARWLGHIIRIAGLCANADDAPETGPWEVPEDIEKLLECKDVEALRKLRYAGHQAAAQRLIDPKEKFQLGDEHVSTLDLIADYELTNADSTPLAHLLLAEPPANERAIRDRVTVLSDKGCIEISGPTGHELLDLTTAGLLASNCATRADAMVARLLSYYRTRLSAEGLKFQEFTWENLKAAGVAKDDSEFGWFVQVLPLLRLVGRRQHGAAPSPHAEWGVPRNVVQLRAATSITDLVVLDSFKPQVAQHGPEGPQQRKEAAMKPDQTKVFIIHGRNTDAKNAVEHFVRALGLEPLDFDELSASLGGSAFIGDVVREGLNRAQGIIALFTPDEFSALRPELRGTKDRVEEKQRWQARPNVIFEAGMAYGMDPKRTVLVTIGGEVSLFSDVGGVHVVRLSNTSGRSTLRQKLIGMGCAVNERADSWTDPARSGDFEGCIAGLSEVSPPDPFDEPTAATSSEADAERDSGMSAEARAMLDWLQTEYIKAGYPNYKTWGFKPSKDNLRAFAELRANFFIEQKNNTQWRLTDLGLAYVRRPK